MEQNKYLKLIFLAQPKSNVQQVTSGDFDVNEIVGFQEVVLSLSEPI
jgi:hypothetical protein